MHTLPRVQVPILLLLLSWANSSGGVAGNVHNQRQRQGGLDASVAARLASRSVKFAWCRAGSVAFRLCAGVGNDVCGDVACQHYPSEFAVDLPTYLTAATAHAAAVWERHCRDCAACATTVTESSPTQDPQAACESIDLATCLTECVEVEGMVDAAEFIQCQPTYEDETTGQMLFAGPACDSDGIRIKIGLFRDEGCAVQDESKNLEDFLNEDGLNLSYHLLKQTHVTDRCVASCLDDVDAGGDWRLHRQRQSISGQGPEAPRISEFCEWLYHASGLGAPQPSPLPVPVVPHPQPYENDVSRTPPPSGTLAEGDGETWAGDDCSRECLNGGTCVRALLRQLQSDWCQCRRGYSGEHCESVSAPTPAPSELLAEIDVGTMDGDSCSRECLNGGTCVLGSGIWTDWCQCPPGYFGERCETVYVPTPPPSFPPLHPTALPSSSYLQLVSPEGFEKEGGYNHRLALFGPSTFFGTPSLSTKVYYANSELCDGNNVGADIGYPSRKTESNILMVDRGSCTFVTKARNAYELGAWAVIIADNNCLCDVAAACFQPADRDCELSWPILADNGSGEDIGIPTFVMTKQDADSIKDQMRQNIEVVVELSFLQIPPTSVGWPPPPSPPPSFLSLQPKTTALPSTQPNIQSPLEDVEQPLDNNDDNSSASDLSPSVATVQAPSSEPVSPPYFQTVVPTSVTTEPIFFDQSSGRPDQPCLKFFFLTTLLSIW